MPVSDIRLKIGFLDHPKTRLLIRDLGDAALPALLRLWMHAAVNHPRGDLSALGDDGIECAGDWRGTPGAFVSALRQRRFLDDNTLHDWSEHQAYAYHGPERSQWGRDGAVKRYGQRAIGGDSTPDRPTDGSTIGQPIGQPMLSSLLFSSPPPPKKRRREEGTHHHPFVRPEVEEVREYCAERKNHVDAQRFVDYYEMRGWVVGKSRTPVRDWKACIRTWERRDHPAEPETGLGKLLDIKDFIPEDARASFGL